MPEQRRSAHPGIDDGIDVAQTDVADADLVERHRRHLHHAVRRRMGLGEVAGVRLDAELVGIDEIKGNNGGAGIDHEADRRAVDLGDDEEVAVRFRSDADGPVAGPAEGAAAVAADGGGRAIRRRRRMRAMIASLWV